MKYTPEQLMPKRYPENKPSKTDKIFWTLDNNWLPYIWNNRSWPWTSFDFSAWFIDIPGAPEELRPCKYPDVKPEREGKYIAHEKINDKWFVNEWRGALPSGDDYFSWRVIVDYFIPYPLEEEMEEKIVWQQSKDVYLDSAMTTTLLETSRPDSEYPTKIFSITCASSFHILSTLRMIDFIPSPTLAAPVPTG